MSNHGYYQAVALLDCLFGKVHGIAHTDYSDSLVSVSTREYMTTYLSIIECPEVDNLANNVIQSSVRALIIQEGGQRQQWEKEQAELDGLMNGSASQRTKRPFKGQSEDAKEQVYRLQDWHWFDCLVEIGGEPVDEDLGPEQSFKRTS